MFCSELVAEIYRRLGWLAREQRPSLLVPGHFGSERMTLRRRSAPDRPRIDSAAENPRLPRSCPVARVVVDVMPKPEILDPQGKAVLGALPRLGFSGVSDVRQGKRFELTFDGEVTAEVLAEVEKMAETLLSNPVIENFDVRVEK